MYNSWTDESRKISAPDADVCLSRIYLVQMWCNTEVGRLIRDGQRSVETSPDRGFWLKVGVNPCSHDVGSKGWKTLNHRPWVMQPPGEVWNPPPDLLRTLSLPDRTWKLSKKKKTKLDSVVSVVSTCILHDSNRGRNFFQCFVNFELSEHCVCVT